MPLVPALSGAVYLAGLVSSLTLAQSQSVDATFWIQWGVLGVIVLLMMTGHLSPGWVVKQKDEQIDTLRGENEALRAKVTDEVLPAVIESTRVLSEAVDALRGK